MIQVCVKGMEGLGIFAHGVESRDGAVASIRTIVSGQYDYLGWVLPPLVKVDVRCWILRLLVYQR